MKSNSLKRKFIIFAIILLIPIATSNIISMVLNNRIINNYAFMLNKMSAINDIKSNLSASYIGFSGYILTNAVDSRNSYETSYTRAINDVKLLMVDSDLNSQYILRDLYNTMLSYKAAGDKTIEVYNNQKGIDVYYPDYMNTKEIQSYCATIISKLIDSNLDYNTSIYNKRKEDQTIIIKILVSYIVIALLISIVYTTLFLKNIIDKLKELVNTSKKVSQGDFTDFSGKQTEIYELDILSEAFGTMIKDIKLHINSMQENAELERKLRDDEMNLLKYQNALKLSQLKVLQSQINPHFLFNTLNCINQTAIQENAIKTESLIKSVSGILRYSLSMMNRFATLAEEINVVKQYMFIQELRYQDRIEFRLNIAMDLDRVKVPGMTLQPFVENAFIHGIEPKEDGGTISIHIYEQDHCCMVLIEDDGMGIEEDTLINIRAEDTQEVHIGHTTGMGMKSVVSRLELMYDREDLFQIQSKLGQGTKVFLKIPIEGLEDAC